MMWRFIDNKNKPILGYEDGEYIGEFGDEFVFWATDLVGEIAISPVGPWVKWPFRNEVESWEAGMRFMRVHDLRAVASVPPKGAEEKFPEGATD
jgi:hypothetical protein